MRLASVTSSDHTFIQRRCTAGTGPVHRLSSVSDKTALQEIAERTYGVVTPSNLLDVAAMVGVAWSARRLDTWKGITVGASSYLADVADGIIARRTQTTSTVGEVMDHVVGDKPKLMFGLYHIWRFRLADRPLVAAVAGYNVANALVTGYDWASNTEPQVQVTVGGKRAMFATANGVGIQVIGRRVGVSHPAAGRLLRVVGTLIGWSGLAIWGVPTTLDYWRSARRGPKRRKG
jgi:phosphatidylglycerophosphate synthase